MVVLEHDDLVPLQILGIVQIHLTAFVVAHHPADMSKPQAALDGVGVLLHIVHMAMVFAVTGAPDQDGVLDRTGAPKGEECSYQRVGIIGPVRPQAVIAAGNGQAAKGEHQPEYGPFNGVIAFHKAINWYGGNGNKEG